MLSVTRAPVWVTYKVALSLTVDAPRVSLTTQEKTEWLSNATVGGVV
ncbi:hypothetical protein BMS3Abin04_01516 [bacterium BMS3Abin04]|nr:hypothetical protein BMS3Abin04_01516 [bacterium BMS3Abin04]